MKRGLGGNPKVTLRDYPERDHAFTREGGKNYHAGDARAADERTIAFFRQHLA
jgi:carboxymethylenebutenolidase